MTIKVRIGNIRQTKEIDVEITELVDCKAERVEHG
jgi:hypothetical protein